MHQHYNYALFHEFVKKFKDRGFKGIDRQDPMVAEMEDVLQKNGQFFYIADLITMKILFTSKGSLDYLGTEPDLVDPGSFFRAIHPDDRQRHSLGRAKLFKTGNALFDKQSGYSIHSTTFRLNNGTGHFNNIHFGGYTFFSALPQNTVYHLMILTDVSTFKLNKHGYPYYWGNDLANFRYPDEALLKLGHDFSDREFEIIKLIASGLNSQQIAQTLFLSVNTINTHRRNMLKKTNKPGTRELIIELQERGVL